MSTESEFMSNALTVRMRYGYTLVLERVPDLDGLAPRSGRPCHKATTPPPAPPVPALTALAPPVGPAVGQLPPPAPTSPARPAPATQPDVLVRITKLGELHVAGVLTDEEFRAKKTEPLNRL
jgi:hypothetical protein